MADARYVGTAYAVHSTTASINVHPSTGGLRSVRVDWWTAKVTGCGMHSTGTVSSYDARVLVRNSMRVLETIPTLDLKRLADLEENARRWAVSGTETQKVDAECVLLAITTERARRKDQADDQRKRLAVEVAARVKDKGLFDRVLMAFTEMVPEQWEVEILKEIGGRPDQHFNKIAKAIGKRGGGYVNLAVGSLCSSREAYLGPFLPTQRVYSDFLINFALHREPDGSEWHGWTLKPEAEAALRQLKIVA